MSQTTTGTASATEARVRQVLADAIDAAEQSPAIGNHVVRGADLLAGEAFAIDFEQELAAEVVADVLAFARAIGEKELVPYDPSFQPTSAQVLFDDLSQTPELAALNEQVLAGTAPIDRGSDEHALPVVALVHRLDGEHGVPIVAYRIKGPGIATRRPRGIRILVPRDGVWERVTEELLYYQPRFDVLVVDRIVIVTAPTTLQRALGSDERAKRMARDTFKAATARIDIEGRSELTDAIGSDPAMIAKMAQLSRTLEADPGYAEFLTTPRLLEFLDDNPQIPIAIEGEGTSRHLVFESSPQKRYLIPKALADDFLRSELTDRRYEAGSKQRIDG